MSLELRQNVEVRPMTGMRGRIMPSGDQVGDPHHTRVMLLQLLTFGAHPLTGYDCSTVRQRLMGRRPMSPISLQRPLRVG